MHQCPNPSDIQFKRPVIDTKYMMVLMVTTLKSFSGVSGGEYICHQNFCTKQLPLLVFPLLSSLTTVVWSDSAVLQSQVPKPRSVLTNRHVGGGYADLTRGLRAWPFDDECSDRN